MSRHALHFTSRSLCVVMAIAWAFGASSSPPVMAQYSAEEILNKSKEAMKPPIQYRIRTSGIDAKVYQKIMPDGTLASRTETEVPFPKISLVLGNDSYDAFPSHGIALDTRFMLQKGKAQASTIASAIEGQPANSAKIIGMVVRDGRECYQVETTISPSVIAAFSKTLPENARKMLPSGNRFIIDKETFLMVEVETLSGTSSSTNKQEYKDIVLNPAFSNELFLLPVGLDVQKPNSIMEYSAVVSEIIQSRLPISDNDIDIPSDIKTEPPLPRRPRLGPVTIDPATGEAIPPLPIGMTRLEFNVRTDPPKPPLKMPPNRSWIEMFLMLLPLPVALILLVVRHKRASLSARTPTK